MSKNTKEKKEEKKNEEEKSEDAVVEEEAKEVDKEEKNKKKSDGVKSEKMDEISSDNPDVLEIKEDCSDIKKRNKTFIAIIVLLAGVACGSFFVDVVQLFTQKGFSAKALEDAQVIEYDGNTWVRYDDPKIVVEVFDADDCEECVTDEVLVRLRSLIPTLEAHRINVRTDEGNAYAAENEIKHIPAFLFDGNVIESDFYQQAAILFKDNGDGKQYFEAPSVGVPIGEYLESPSDSNGIALDENADAATVVVLYDNPTAKESGVAYPILEKIRSEQKENMHVVVKIVPDSEQKNSVQSAIALYCADKQGKYNEYAQTFYGDHKNVTETDTIKDVLQGYATKLQMDVEQFVSCVDSSDVKNVIDENVLESSKFGVISAPTFFINGEPHIGVITYQGLKEKIEGTSAVEEVE